VNADAIVDVYLATFAGGLGDDPAQVRPGAFGTVHPGEPGRWMVVHRPPTTDEVRLAFTSPSGLSLPFLGPDNRGHVAAFDCDGPNAHEDADRLGRAAWSIGIPAWIDQSRSGAHVWISLDRRLRALVLRLGLCAIAETAGFPAHPQLLGARPDPAIELRPELSGLGGMLRAPSTRSPKEGPDGTRTRMFDPRDGAELPRRLEELLTVVQQARAERFLEIVERWVPPSDFPGLEVRTTRLAPFPADHGAPPASHTLQTKYQVERAVPGRSVRCPFHDDASPSLSIAPDDERVWCKAPGCIANRDGRGLGSWELDRLEEVPA